MGNLKINTDYVVSAATKIKNYNAQIRAELANVQNAISQLNAEWDGSAANSTINKFNEIKSKFSDARYAVVDNYVNFMFQQVGEGYTQTEEVNKSLADAFK